MRRRSEWPTVRRISFPQENMCSLWPLSLALCNWGGPILCAGNGGDRPDVPHAPADSEARPTASVQQSAAEQSAAAMAAANAEAAGAAAQVADGANAAAAAAPQGEAAAEQGGSDVVAAPVEDAPEKQEVSATFCWLLWLCWTALQGSG